MKKCIVIIFLFVSCSSIFTEILKINISRGPIISFDEPLLEAFINKPFQNYVIYVDAIKNVTNIEKIFGKPISKNILKIEKKDVNMINDKIFLLKYGSFEFEVYYNSSKNIYLLYSILFLKNSEINNLFAFVGSSIDDVDHKMKKGILYSYGNNDVYCFFTELIQVIFKIDNNRIIESIKITYNMP
jgi:hypothetical protein